MAYFDIGVSSEGNVDKRKFILKNGLFQGTSGVDYSIAGTATAQNGYIEMNTGTNYYNVGIGVHIDRSKYKKLVFACYSTNTSSSIVRTSISSTVDGTKTTLWGSDLTTIPLDLVTTGNDWVWLLPRDSITRYYDIYME